MEQSASSPRMVWVCFRKEFFTSSLLLFSSFRNLMMEFGFFAMLTILDWTQPGWKCSGRNHCTSSFKLLVPAWTAACRRMPCKGQGAPSPAAIHAPPPHGPRQPQTPQERPASNGRVSERPCLLGYGQTDGVFRERILLNTSLPYFLPSATEKIGLH